MYWISLSLRGTAVTSTCTCTSPIAYMGSLVSKSVAWKADGRGFKSHGAANFSLKNDCFG